MEAEALHELKAKSKRLFGLPKDTTKETSKDTNKDTNKQPKTALTKTFHGFNEQISQCDITQPNRELARHNTSHISSLADKQTGAALNQIVEMFPFLDMVNIQGQAPFTEVVKTELIEEALRVSQGMAKTKQHLFGALRTFDIKHP